MKPLLYHCLSTLSVSHAMRKGVMPVFMCAAHVHRLPVVDDSEAPIGTLTSRDVVAALVNAMEEAT